MMITYKSRFLIRAEVWYDNEADDTRSVDWIVYYQRSSPVSGAKTKFFYTYVIDLAQKPEQLQSNLNKDTAYKIRRARERDKIVCECCDPRDPAVMGHFEQMYNAFAAMKGLPRLERARMESMAAAGALDLSAAKDAEGHVLVYHANYRDNHRATGIELPSLYRKLSDSAERNLIGRANRYLTWNEIMRYKELGLKYFDFGGWYNGSDPAMLKINDFKRGFGGAVLREYQCEQILTLKGWLAFRAASLVERAKLFPARSKQAAADAQPDIVHDPIPARMD
ncbi:MAG: hypothetical protein KGJ60_02935 [Verrucomicrobiota bacterium]|nr:hypothetical protein [Verrucomicrobiota bacterium]